MRKMLSEECDIKHFYCRGEFHGYLLILITCQKNIRRFVLQNEKSYRFISTWALLRLMER